MGSAPERRIQSYFCYVGSVVAEPSLSGKSSAIVFGYLGSLGAFRRTVQLIGYFLDPGN